MRSSSPRRGVTFVELLIVVFIIGILSTSIGIAMSGIIDQSTAKVQGTNLATWKLAAKSYVMEKKQGGAFPRSFSAITAAGLLDIESDSTPFEMVPDSGIIRLKP